MLLKTFAWLAVAIGGAGGQLQQLAKGHEVEMEQ
jgi:hypothetical protein